MSRPTAIIAGASEGLGAEFARQVAAKGYDLVLIARRPGPLETLAEELRAAHGVDVHPLAYDLADPDLAETLAAFTHADLAIYNAAYSAIGAFHERPLSDLMQVVDVNVRGPLTFSHVLGGAMKKRGRGSLVLVSSLSGLQGSPRIATYAASKAFILVLGDALWHELQPVEVVTCCAGAIRTPNYLSTNPTEAPGILDPHEVVTQTLQALGRGPRVMPGRFNRFACTLMALLPRRRAVEIIARNTENLQP